MFSFITYITFNTESVIKPFLLDIAGKRSQYLPFSIKYTGESEEEGKDEFEYKFTESETGSLKKFRITEKRIVTFNPKLAKKQIYEINFSFFFS